MIHLQRREMLFGLAGVTLAHSLLGRVSMALAADKIVPGPSSALIVVDVQNCFLPGGSLAVKDGDQVIPVINRIAKSFQNVVMTQDWHTAHHVSFASSHDGKKPFEMIKLPYGDQVLWPDHCVQGTEGAQIAKDISIPQAQLVIRKGFHNDVDSYSAFSRPTRRPEPALPALEGTQDRHRVRDRAGDRLLRRLDGDGCAQRRPQRLCGRRRMPRHRHQRLGRQGVG